MQRHTSVVSQDTPWPFLINSLSLKILTHSMLRPKYGLHIIVKRTKKRTKWEYGYVTTTLNGKRL